MSTFRPFCFGRPTRRRSVRPLKRLAVQSLERRLPLAADAWIGASGGFWDVAGNWSTGAVPVAGDDVTIDTSSAMTITIQSGDGIAVNSLTLGANDTLVATGPGNPSLQTAGDVVNNGVLTIDAGGKLSVGGNFTQGSTGSLNVQLGGPSGGGQFGQLAVKNTANLAGALNVSLVNAYAPQPGDDFQVMTFASAVGDFATVTGLGTSLVEKLTPTTIDVSAAPPDTVESPRGVNVNTAIGAGFVGTVATFADSNPAAQASQFVVAIDWGDGTTNAGNVTANGGQFQVQGYHDYAHSGDFTITTTIVDRGVATVVTSTAVVLPWANGRINVTTANDTHAADPAISPEDAAGNISLRSAIEYLNATGQANDTVDFDTIYVRGLSQLTLGPIEIGTSLTIDGRIDQLAAGPTADGAASFFQIDKLDANNKAVAATLSNLTLNLGTLAPNNSAAIDNLGSLTLNNVNFVATLAYAPATGGIAALIGGGGTLTGTPQINGAVVNPADDVGLYNLGNIYPFKPDDSSGGLEFTFDSDPTIGVGNSSLPSSGYNDYFGGVKSELPGGDNVTAGLSVPVAENNVVADWRFQEGTAGQPASGPIVDSSGHGLNGAPLNSPVYSANVPWSTVPQTGKPDAMSLQFNGTSQQIVVPDNPAFQLTHSLTVEAEVYVPAATAQYTFGYVLFRGDYREGLDPYTLRISGSGTNLSASFNIEDASNNNAGLSAQLPGVNQWFDIVGTLDDATGAMRLYVNGVELASMVTSVRPLGPLDPNLTPGIGIGSYEGTKASAFFTGLINEVRICDVALTPGQFLGSSPGNLVVTDNGNALLSEPAAALNTLTIDGTNSGATIDVTPNPTVPIIVHGGAPGDTLVLPKSGELSQTFSASSGYAGTWSNAGDQPATFDGIQTLEQKLVIPPTSSVAALPPASPAGFTVSWSGDDAGGPGIGTFNVYVSDNGGPFTAWLTGTTQTSGTWQGQLGHTYGFYSVAVDVAGLAQTTPTAAQATTQTILGEPNANYVAAVYHDVLGRAADAAGLVYWTDLLDRGTAIGSVASAIAHSDEYYANFVIKPDYLKLLGRAADDAGLSNWTAKMEAGLTDQQLEAELVSSNEFFQTAGGANAAWVDAVYKLLLGRPAQADDTTYWVGQLSGGASLLNVAQDIANSAENNAQIIKNDYFHYLGRAADDAGLAYWLKQFASGETNEDVIAAFTASPEYYHKQSQA